MKKKLIYVLCALLVLSGVFIYIFLNKDKDTSNEKIAKNDPEIEKLVGISQAEMSSFVFVTQESESNHILNINLTPFLNFIVEQKEIRSFKISNFKGTNATSEVILIPPTDLSQDTVSRTFLFTTQDSITQQDIQASADSFVYSVLSTASKFNEINSKGVVTPYFGVIIKDIGRVNYKEIMDRDGNFDGGKYLEYSKVALETLDTEIQFDINIQFTDGTKYNKRFKGTLLGEAFATETSPMITLKVVE
ncbi:MAG TPA: hypothetical protein P5059_01940 [Candidatus Dojkabacteria bacterium]|nr:hypothetical protein [Candidatus Dojkabacteria bacterium]